MTEQVLSTSDREILSDLVRKKILAEAKLPDLADTIVVTDAQCAPELISLDMEIPPYAVISNIGGALLIVDGSEQGAREHVVNQMKVFVNKKSTFALVARAPSEYMQKIDVDFVRVIDLLTQAEGLCVNGLTRRSPIASFLVVYLKSNQKYVFQVDSIKFRIWYNEYEQDVLNRQSDSFDDDDNLAKGSALLADLL